MKFLIVIVAVLVVACQIKAEALDNGAFEENTAEATDLENCEERICSRVYSPICVSINKVETTLASMCHLANLRCELMRTVTMNTNYEITDFRVLHLGECQE